MLQIFFNYRLAFWLWGNRHLPSFYPLYTDVAQQTGSGEFERPHTYSCFHISGITSACCISCGCNPLLDSLLTVLVFNPLGWLCTNRFNTQCTLWPLCCVLTCFVRISDHTAIISLYSINWLVFITETESVYCAVQTGCVYLIHVNIMKIKPPCLEVKFSILDSLTLTINENSASRILKPLLSPF